MNIFFIDRDVKICAQYHNNKHIVKMILEYGQLLSTSHHVLDGDSAIQPIYKSTHKNHPSAIWTRSSDAHYEYLHKLLLALCEEYTYRYDKIHKVQRDGLADRLSILPKNIPKLGWLSDPIPAMPDEYKTNNAIESYRKYYNGAKQHIAEWKKREIPSWFIIKEIYES